MLTELLHLVESANTPMTCGQLADRLGADPEVVAGMLDRLTRQGRLQTLPLGRRGTADVTPRRVGPPRSAIPVRSPRCPRPGGASWPFVPSPA